ncbi:hypothetical protein FDA33_10220 [Clostridium botulinum]|nr:hypothetical protein [Clostridium botulinum]KOR55304.1 hypothetical protein ADT22_16980 [Clostridium botulinum]MBN1050370.1 hypothetical protein [Clostridium botulinum]MBY6811067.1 hypothetical protein [Clostridium botulinum]MBY6818544.1 hypothetical protein [Clostridium botulinum]MBY6824535.1 hypothetical protein [Clostridium botulinum]
MKNKKNYKKSKFSIIVVLITISIFTGVIINSASKMAHADTNALDSIEKQILTLKELDYSFKDIKKIIKMTNNDVAFYIEAYTDSIVIGILNSKGEPEDIREIQINKINKK